MLALHPRVVDIIWQAVEPRLPEVVDEHPLGCHRPRRDDRGCFEAILFRLVTGCSCDVAGRLGKGSETTLRRRRDEWWEAGVFDGLVDETLAGYDRLIGFDLSEVSIDGSQHKAPFGGEGTGPNPTDRGKSGWKWSVGTDRNGIPIGWEIAGANRNDCVLLEPTLDAIDGRGLLADVDTMHLDRGYDNGIVRALCAQVGLDDLIVAKKRRRTRRHCHHRSPRQRDRRCHHRRPRHGAEQRRSSVGCVQRQVRLELHDRRIRTVQDGRADEGDGVEISRLGRTRGLQIGSPRPTPGLVHGSLVSIPPINGNYQYWLIANNSEFAYEAATRDVGTVNTSCID